MNAKTQIEDLEDELASLQFDIAPKPHLGMDHISLMTYMDKLKREKAGLVLALKFLIKCERMR